MTIQIVLNRKVYNTYIMKVRIIYFLFVLLCLVSCNKHSELWETLVKAESNILSHPAEALNTLQNIDTTKLVNIEEKAKYALLQAMALEETMKPQMDFNLFLPAYDYYTQSAEGDKESSPAEKLRGRYYAGRIYYNMGDRLAAMQCYANALYKGEKSDDFLTKARIYQEMGRIYNNLHEWDKSVNSYEKAANLFKEIERENDYSHCFINILKCATFAKNDTLATQYVKKCKELLPSMNTDLQSEYYSAHLNYILRSATPPVIKNDLADYLQRVPASKQDHLVIADCYLHLKDYDKAWESIVKCTLPLSEDEARYYAILSDLYKNRGDYPKALEAFSQYSAISDSIYSDIISQDTKFVEYNVNENVLLISQIYGREKITVITVLLLLVTLLLFRTVYKKNKIEKQMVEQEKENYKLLYMQMEQERDNLTELLNSNEELSSEALTSVGKRLDLLNKFFTAYITNNIDIDRKASREMEELLADKENFMTSTRLAFTGSHPAFIKYLQDHGLTDWEIDYCCLYALGLKGKEVGAYINLKRHYNNSSDIRQKLGIDEHATNLGIYIRKLLNGTPN